MWQPEIPLSPSVLAALISRLIKIWDMTVGTEYSGLITISLALFGGQLIKSGPGVPFDVMRFPSLGATVMLSDPVVSP